jgi:hypothetical protein
MKLRVLRGRHRRRGDGVKRGRINIQSLADDEFARLVDAIPWGADNATKRQGRRLKRTLTLMRRRPESGERPLLIKQNFRSSEVLDAIYPERESEWLHSWKRTKTDAVDLSRFSFIDDPIGTMTSLRKIAECEAICRSFSINFLDQFCLDISPYMVLGLLRQKMLPVLVGGQIRKPISRVLHAVHLEDFLRMEKLDHDTTSVWPFPLRQRRAEGSSSALDDTAWAVTSEERVDTKLADTIDEWLGELEPPWQLSETGKANILTLIGEILDNAKRHSHISEDGSWAIAGFMETRRRPSDDGSVAHVCHLAIISAGQTIYDSLRLAPLDMQQRISVFANRHLPRWPSHRRFDERAMWTLSSLQDSISRVGSDDGSINGFGMMTLVEMTNALGSSGRKDEQPRMTIVSGDSCLMVRAPYNEPSRTKEGHRVLALNASNDLQYPPDEDYVFTLPYTFPGTIVALRFCLDSNELIQRNKSKDDTNA